jgi:pimeloyl-ACP methyl ester carboxylesterase
MEVDMAGGEAEAAGVRLLAIEWEALASARAGPLVLIAEQALAELAPDLPLEFSVAGWSGGAPFALAVASLVPQRARRTMLMCPIPGWLRGRGAIEAASPRLASIAAGTVPPGLQRSLEAALTHQKPPRRPLRCLT